MSYSTCSKSVPEHLYTCPCACSMSVKCTCACMWPVYERTDYSKRDRQTVTANERDQTYDEHVKKVWWCEGLCTVHGSVQIYEQLKTIENKRKSFSGFRIVLFSITFKQI